VDAGSRLDRCCCYELDGHGHDSGEFAQVISVIQKKKISRNAAMKAKQQRAGFFSRLIPLRLCVKQSGHLLTLSGTTKPPV
jgi:hypothetical protein